MNISKIPADWKAIIDNPIILDAADTDGYMARMYAIFSGNPMYHTESEFRFINRKVDQKLAQIIPAEVFKAHLDHVWTLRFPQYAIDYMKSQNFLRKGDYRRLQNFKWPNLRFETDRRGQYLISTDGILPSAFMPEIPILRIESTLYTVFSCIEAGYSVEQVEAENLAANIRDLKMLIDYEHETGVTLQFGDFACRRPALPHLHDFNVDWWIEHGDRFFSGTSWIGKAARTGKPIQASVGHVFMIANAAIRAGNDTSLRNSHAEAIDEWLDFCNVVTAQSPDKPVKKIIVSDTHGTKFARNGGITHEQAMSLEVLRPDSGNPYEEGRADVEFWRKHGRDPMKVGTLFADGVDVPTSINLHRQLGGLTQVIIARGGDFGNKIAGKLISKQSTVFKPWYINGRPCVKLSNDSGKVLSPDPDEVTRYRRVFAVS